MGSNGWLIYSAIRSVQHEAPFIPASLKEGDLIVRRSGGLISTLLASASRVDKRYSHAGVIHFESRRCRVVHCIDATEGPSGLRSESLEEFLDPTTTLAYALYRFPLSGAERSVSAYVCDSALQAGLSFDRNFNLEESSFMYCTEWVRYCIGRAAGNRIRFLSTQIDSKEYLAIDNLYLNQAYLLYTSRRY